MEMNLTWPWEAMHDAFFLPDKVVTIRSCRRSFKTHGATRWLLEEMFEEDVENGLWVDTTQANIDKYIERYFRVILKDVWGRCNYNAQKKILTLPNLKQIDFGSAERPENLEGFEYTRVVLNEGGIILKKPSLWNNSIFPMTKPINNKTRIIGTPKSKNKFQELSVMHKDVHFTVYDCPFYTTEQIEKIKTQLPQEVFRQEYLAEFLEGAGSVFRNIGACIREPKGQQADIMAIDLAKHQDFTVIMLGNQKDKQVVKIDRFNQIDWTFQKNRIVNLWEHNGRPKVIMDSTGVGDPIYDDLRNHGMNIEGYKFTNQSKAELIQGLSVAMDNNEIFFPNDSTLISELEVFGYDVSPSGKIRYNAPEGLHDDMVISLSLFNYLLKNAVSVKLSWV